MKLTICDLFLSVIIFGLTIGFCVLTNADSFNTATSLPYPSESETGAFSHLNIMPEVVIDADKYIEQTEGIQLIPSKEVGDLYLSNIAQNGRRNSIFQKLNCSSMWIPEGGDEGLGLIQSDISLVFAFPLPTEKSPLIITPSFSHKRFNYKFSDAIDSYTTGVDFRWLFPVIEKKLSFDLAVSVLYSGTFEGNSSKSMRYPAHIAAIWNFNPRLKLILGVAYLDRSDEYNWLPIGGLIWTPNPDVNVELLFPIMRIARRLNCFDQFNINSRQNFTRWIYCGMELGSGSFYYVNKSTEYEIDYHDFRFMIGYEHRYTSGITFSVETGCTTGRELEFKRLQVYKPDTGFFIRLRFTF
ncbi:MAG: hypothetical protein LBC74_06905 [Planctomycetaceae bacterium]|jgi:hypothetical protein|nr:hypothetical protein [Planctomycetaceae bacterium]